MENKSGTFEHVVDLRSFASGSYIVLIEDRKTRSWHRLIKY
jgi:hypothetical protein